MIEKKANQTLEVNEMVKIEVLGTGCAKCKSLTKERGESSPGIGH